MEFKLTLRTDEPCDIYLVCKSQELWAVVVESTNGYAEKLSSDLEVDDFCIVCGKHSFRRRDLEVVVVDDFALVDGTACYEVPITAYVQEVLERELSGS